MTEPIRDTPSVARPYCPACEPDTDPGSEILDVRWCSAHTPVSGGVDDEVVAMESYPAGSGEAGGEDNRRWCALFHRQARPTTKRRLAPTLRVPRARPVSVEGARAVAHGARGVPTERVGRIALKPGAARQLLRREAPPERVFARLPRFHELQEVVRTTRLVA